MVVRVKNIEGKIVELDAQIASSGEATIWTTTNNSLAKIYNERPSIKQIEKLLLQIHDAPTDPNLKHGHFSWAMPTNLLFQTVRASDCIGFLMPRVTGGIELVNVYNALKRRKLNLNINWQFLHVTAMNLASIVGLLHAKDYVIGDMKPQNILVGNRALPTIIDCDSFQLKSLDGSMLYCPVGSEGFTPPELLGADLKKTTQTTSSDRFRLAVIIFLILFGEHPFRQSDAAGEPIPINDAIRKGLWSKNSNSKRIIPFDVIHPGLQDRFVRCFELGHKYPSSRPSANEWNLALKQAFGELIHCSKNPNHYYSNHMRSCYWCERAKTLNYDLFDSSPQPKAGSKPTPTPAPAPIPRSPKKPTVLRADDTAGLFLAECKTAIVTGTLTKITGNGNTSKLLLWLGTTKKGSKFGAFRIGITADLNSVLFSQLQALLKKEVSVQGTVFHHKRGEMLYPEISLKTRADVEQFLNHN